LAMAGFLLLRRRRSWLGAHYQRISLKPFCGMKFPLGRIEGPPQGTSDRLWRAWGHR
jgi:hypothetical protein